ncbi:MAG: glycosyltransferase family 4 protein [Novosphingobium sp.]
MKVFVTGLRGIPQVMGGIESHCEELLPRVKLRNRDLDISVLCRAPYFEYGKKSYRGLSLIPLPSPRSKSLEAIVATFLATLYAWMRGADVLHIHGIGPALLTPLARVLRLKVIVTHHGADYERAKWGRLAKLILRVGERSGLIWAHQVIAVSPSLATHLKEIFPSQADKVTYIPNGAPQLRYEGLNARETLERLGLRPGGYILAVGRLVPEKGLHDLVQAFKASDPSSGLVLAIAGDANHDSEYARELRAHASDRILFLNFQPRPILKCLYANCSLFVMPSYHEGLPIAALEAASCAAPMLLSDIAANRDIGLNEDCYFPVGDTDLLAELLTADRQPRIVDAHIVKRRFDWDNSARSTAALYRSFSPPARAATPLTHAASRSGE